MSEARARIEDELGERAARSPREEALVEGERVLDYAALDEESLVFARRLVAAGVRPGERVVHFLDKTRAAVAALYGTWRAGAVVVPASEALRGRQLAHIVDHSEASALVSTRRLLARAAYETPPGVTLVDPGAPSGSARPRQAEQAAEGPRGSAGPGPVQSPTPTPSEGASAPAELPPRGALAGGDELAAILYTSGSTGRPKGIALSHANLRAGARIVARYLGTRADDRLLSVLPFSFDYGLNQLLQAVHVGAALVLQRSHLPADIVRTLVERRVTVFAAVPPLFIQLLGPHSPLPDAALPHLRLMTNSGGVFPVELVRRYRALFPHVQIVLMYGLSEAFRSTYVPPEMLDEHPHAMGRAIPECEVFVLREDGREAQPGQPGELVHRGPTVALGYWRDPEATARVFRPDPFDAGAKRPVVYSGDLVRREDSGLLVFVARRDAMIKSYGYRISPDEVEELALESGLLAEVAARGEADEEAGARVVLYVVPKEPAGFESEALFAHCRAAMPRYMVPREIHVRESLPRTGSGKLDRKSLR